MGTSLFADSNDVIKTIFVNSEHEEVRRLNSEIQGDRSPDLKSQD